MNSIIMGYDDNGNIIESEAAVVKYIFSHYHELRLNPPEEIIEAKIEEAKGFGVELSREDAIDSVSHWELCALVLEDIKKNPEFVETIKAYNERVKDNAFSMAEDVGTVVIEQRNIRRLQKYSDEHSEIISKDTWQAVQEKMASKKAPRVATYVRVSPHDNADAAVEKQKERLEDFCKARGFEITDSTCTIGDRHLGYEMFLDLLEKAEAEGLDRIVISSIDRVAGTPEEIEAIKSALEGKHVSIETPVGDHVVFDYEESDEPINPMRLL